MNLHEDKEVFAQYVTATADFMGLKDTGIVEKDYFVTFFLQKIKERQLGVVFKGGTSLSKCYKLINRFSEDIDLNVETPAEKFTESQRKRLKQDIITVIDDAGFYLVNPEQVRSRRDFNRYVIDYQPAASFSFLKQYLVVETVLYIKSFPTETMNAASFVYDFLLEKNAGDEIKKYGLEPFEIEVQTKERTFIDKVFAIVDYYLDGHVDAHSRHIYDLYKIYPEIIFDSAFEKLISQVREVRKSHSTCPSAQDGVSLQILLQKIVDEDFYKADYHQITELLLFERIAYAEVVVVFQKIIDSGYFG